MMKKKGVLNFLVVIYLSLVTPMVTADDWGRWGEYIDTSNNVKDAYLGYLGSLLHVHNIMLHMDWLYAQHKADVGEQFKVDLDTVQIPNTKKSQAKLVEKIDALKKLIASTDVCAEDSLLQPRITRMRDEIAVDQAKAATLNSPLGYTELLEWAGEVQSPVFSETGEFYYAGLRGSASARGRMDGLELKTLAYYQTIIDALGCQPETGASH